MDGSSLEFDRVLVGLHVLGADVLAVVVVVACASDIISGVRLSWVVVDLEY